MAFESSPIHCLKLLPSGKHRKPVSAGARAILQGEYSMTVSLLRVAQDLPMENLTHQA